MSLATTRERRINAGNQMAKIMDAEEDDFYRNTYGGFDEKEDDEDYKEEKEVEDVTDSDISIDENDEVISDDESEVKRKRMGVTTKAYKEPKPLHRQSQKNENVAVKSKKHISKIIQSKVDKLERKSIRRSTAAKSAATMQRLKHRIEVQRKRKLKRAPQQEAWKPTQEELLEEAKVTEEENLKSLEKYQKMELEKKKTRIVKKVFTGPVIRYQSLTMPLIKDIAEEKVIISDEQSENKADDISSDKELETKNEETEQKVERTFITFENEEILESIFKKTKQEERPKYCPITRLKAKYFDPVTNLPFSNLQAFRILREAYYQQLEAKGNRNQPQVIAWLKWRKQQKESQMKKLLKIAK